VIAKRDWTGREARHDEHMAARHETEPGNTPRRILVPVDDEPRECPALARAEALAGALGAELLLLGVNTLPLAADTAPPSVVLTSAEPDAENDAMERMTRERVAEAQDRVPSGVHSRAVFGWGPAGAAIIDVAREERADLIVVPMTRGGTLSHLLHDGADRHVLHESGVPVLVVPTP
jgi:nucleotide-binding universal stress UspA family protein